MSGFSLINATADVDRVVVTSRPPHAELQAPRRLLTALTATDPPFTFVYDDDDDDMHRFARDNVIVEPTLTRAWHEATWRCCPPRHGRPRGLVVDVGANFGWYALYSLALGCDVLAFEPVGAYAEVLSAAALLNEGFASRLTLLRNVVYSQRGTYQLRVPIAFDRRKTSYRKKLGMTGMIGAKGLVKGYPAHWRNFNASARSVRIDELVDRDVCMFKVDVEG